MGRTSTEPTGAPVMVGVIVEDPLRLAGLRELLEVGGGFRVVPLTGVERRPGTPLLALVDAASAPYLEALLMQLQRTWPEALVLVLGPEADLEQIARIIGMGAKGYLPYVAKEQELRMALNVVLEGSIWAPRKVLARLLNRRQSAPDDQPALTPREQEVLRLLVQGRPNRAIADALGLDEATVKAHLARLMRKLRVRNRIALSLHALAGGTADCVDE